jgi:uncharacterized membrane protein YhaH (DUF805 family)
LFSGRARRSEFWCWILFFVLCSFTTSAIDASAGLLTEDGLGPVNMLATVALLVPTLAVTVRRLHDTGRSGWFYFLSLIPIVGTIAILSGPCPTAKASRTPTALFRNALHHGDLRSVNL